MTERDWRRDEDRDGRERDDDGRSRPRPWQAERFSRAPYGREPENGDPYRERPEGCDAEHDYGRRQGTEYLRDRSEGAPLRRSDDDDIESSRRWRGRSRYPEAPYADGRRYASEPYPRGARDFDTAWTYYEFWQTPGPYSGRGPTGYRRATERIKEDVCDRLQAHGNVDASQITVEVSDDGDVTLSGTVRSRLEKRLSDDVAESVRGVKDVHNHLTVKDEDNVPTPSSAPFSEPLRSRSGRDER